MKKLDLVIIIIVLAIGISIFALYFDRTYVDVDSAQLGIYYNSMPLDDPIYFKETTDLTYEITSSEDMKKLIIVKIDGNKGTTIQYEKNISQKLPIGRKVVIKNGVIKITEAVCENKDCTRMQMTSKNTSPILCINGLAVMFKEFKVISGGM